MNFSKTIKDAFLPLFAGNSGLLRILWLPALVLLAGAIWGTSSADSFYSRHVEFGLSFDLDAITAPSLAYYFVLAVLISVASIKWHRARMFGSKTAHYFWIIPLNTSEKIRRLASQIQLTFLFRAVQLFGVLTLSSVVISLLFGLTAIGPEMVREYGTWIAIPVQLAAWIFVPVAALSLAAVSVGAKNTRIRDFFRSHFDAAPALWLVHIFVYALSILAVLLVCLIVFFMVFGFIQIFSVPVPEFDQNMVLQGRVWSQYYIKVPMFSATVGIHEQVAAKYNLDVAAIAQAATYSDGVGKIFLPLLLLLAHSGANASIYKQLKGKVTDGLAVQDGQPDNSRALPSEGSAQWQLPKSLEADNIRQRGS